MRLTLRNMLAYLDGILEPQDAQDLGNKIEESKFASDLMHRIRDLLRRLRLAAPSVSERGPGLDPNTVAEYLDNTLPADRVTDFEKVCLEANTTMADIHLAEVAACHQILTIVLGEPANIEPASRDRMYELPSQAKTSEPAPVFRAARLPPPIPPQVPQHPFVPQDYREYKSRTKPTVPEYLREPRKKRSWFMVSAGILAAVCLLLIFLNVFHQLEPGSPLGNFFVNLGLISPTEEIASSESSRSEAKNTAAKENDEPLAETKSAVEKSSPEEAKTEKTPATTNAEAGILPAKEPRKASPGETPTSPPLPQTAQESAPGRVEEKTAPSLPANAIPPSPVPLGGETPAAAHDKGMPGEAVASPNEKPPETVPPNDNKVAPSATPPLTPPVEATPATPKWIGRFTSPDQILLSSTEPGSWERLPRESILSPQQHLLALPTYRPTITLSSGLILQMLGGTELTLLPADQQSPSGIKIRYGRVVINSVANSGMRLRLVIGDQTYYLTFLDAESNVGIEVRSFHAAGTNPEGELTRLTTEIFVTKDRISWEEGGAKPVEIVAPYRILMLPQIPPISDHPKDFPKWIAAAEPVKEIDRRASQNMQPLFTPEQPAQQKLLELADPTQTRLKEVRWLAIRSLGYLGYFDTMVSVLSDPTYKGEWSDYYIEWLREAIARDPQSAAAVREALEKHYNPRAANLYRMLWGYTDKDLIAGEDAKMVKNLDDENLEVRVLAIWNLKDITGKDLGYKPEAPLAQRLPMVRRWEQRLETKEIRLKSTEKKTGIPIPEPPPSPPPAVDVKA